MNDAQIRIACLDAAVRTVGNPNHLQTAREYYAFVMENDTPDMAAEEPVKAIGASKSGSFAKGNRKG